ncbi:uncharacterized protein LOC123559426 [Mercenaria mercenaria]|uniref:uncharacterized protein LOC123559426 n=1 Tax=Mercenaria mercenaria TaxID=6596 RepID=UPI00234E88F5|nr:uncharacterized protein LOC123559426 [Mercenaria mercenaria]
MAQVPQNRVYLFRLQTLIIDGGTAVVRNIFDQKRTNVPLNILLNNEKGTINRLRASKAITQTQFDLLYPQSGQLPTIADFDLTLVICLLRNLKCCGLNKHFAWNVIPQPGDTSLEAELCRLRMFRNEISHISSTTGIHLAIFKQKWMEIEQVLNRLNLLNPVQNLQQFIHGYKYSPLDPKAEKKLQTEIQNWRNMEKGLETEIHLVKKDVLDVTKEVGNVKKEVDSVKEDVNIVKKDVAKEVGKVKEDVVEVKKDVAKEVGKVKEDVVEVKKDVAKEVGKVKEDVVEVKKDVAKEVGKVKEDVAEVKKDVTKEVGKVKKDVAEVKKDVDVVKKDVAKEVGKVQEDVDAVKENVTHHMKAVKERIAQLEFEKKLQEDTGTKQAGDDSYVRRKERKLQY